MAAISEELTSLLERLSPADQRSVVEYARSLAHSTTFPRTPLPPGTPGAAVIRFSVSPEMGEAMERALEDCEQIEQDEE